MEEGTIGDGVAPLFEFEWEDGTTRTSDEIGDLDSFDCDISDIAEVGRDDPECDVRIIGFE